MGDPRQRGSDRAIPTPALVLVVETRDKNRGSSDPRSTWRHIGIDHLRDHRFAALFLLWTPSGIIWYRADGTAFVLIFGLYAATWLLLLKASFDAGAEVQSGALGWMSLLGKIKPVFPEMPTQGLFRLIRQPIYVAFALTLWAVPVWTPDQLALAISYTAYFLIAPRLKEKRFEQRYGAAFDRYRDRVPYIIPRRTALKRTTKEPKDGASPAQQP